MRCSQDNTFSTIPIQDLDEAQRDEMQYEIKEHNKAYLRGFKEDFKNGSLPAKIISILIIVCFILAIYLMVFFASKNNVAAVFGTFFGLFAVLGLVSLFSSKSKSQRGTLILITMFGLGGVAAAVAKNVMPELQDVNFLAIIFPFMFIFTGIAFLIATTTGFGLHGRTYNKKVPAECVGYQYSMDEGFMVCSPVYQYNVNGTIYTSYDEAVHNPSSVNVRVGEVREIYVDSTDPDYCAEKSSGVNNAVLVIIGLLCIALGVFVAYFAYQQKAADTKGRTNIEIIRSDDGRIVLTDELIKADRQANIEYNLSILKVMKYACIVLAVSGFAGIIRAVIYFLDGKREDADGKNVQSRLVLVGAACFMTLLFSLIAYSAASSEKNEQKNSTKALTIKEYNIVEKTYDVTHNSSNDTKDYTYYLITDSGEKLKVSQDVYDSAKMTGIYYMSVGESGGIVRAYYSKEYTPDR